MDTNIKYKDIKNTCLRCLLRLWVAKKIGEQHYDAGPSGWIPVEEFQRSYIGGSSAGRRIRELRKVFNVPIRLEVKQIRGRKVWCYYLNCDLRQINWQEILEQGHQWRYREQQLEVFAEV